MRHLFYVTTVMCDLPYLLYQLYRYHLVALHHLCNINTGPVAMAYPMCAVWCQTTFTFHYPAHRIHDPQVSGFITTTSDNQSKVGRRWIGQDFYLKVFFFLDWLFCRSDNIRISCRAYYCKCFKTGTD